MRKSCVKRAVAVLTAVLLLAMACTGCLGGGNSKGLLLSLSFDEGSGNQVSDG